MGSNRLEVVRFVTRDPRYRDAYRELFGESPDFSDSKLYPESASPYGDREARSAWDRLPAEAKQAVNRGFANLGKSIAAYERLLAPGSSRFDEYVDQLESGDRPDALGADEIAGLRLFVDAARTQCLRCHGGPQMTNHSFHDVASGRLGGRDMGRFLGAQSLLLDEFNCLGPYSDAPPESCQELEFLNRREIGEKVGAFKTPTLRGVQVTGPYFHNGSLETLEQVVEHYRNPPDAPNHELPALDLSDAEARQLVAFLKALSAPIAADPSWLSAPVP